MLCYFRVALFLFLSFSCAVFAQEKPPLKDTVAQQDVNDIFRRLFKKNSKADTTFKKTSSLAILPSIGYTPSTGFMFGADVSVTKIFGNPKTTTISIFDAFGAVSTNQLALIQLKHNVYSEANQWYLDGSWEFGKTVVLDHGIGTGKDDPGISPIRYTYAKLYENIYHKIFDNFYAGAGFAFNYYTNIDDERENSANSKTRNHFYSVKNGFPTYGYTASGLSVNLQYDTRDQPFRAYKGVYINLSLRSNRKWLGSDESATQLKTELRKYWSLSKKNPEHVLAFWLWGSYLLKGKIPYLELPGTGSDTYQRLGRGYTIARFKGPSYFYNELEYRFPITANKLISGVTFFNMQTANNQFRTRLLEYWEAGGGAGLRILFNKHTRTNLCLDYGFGNGSNGVFVGINEAF
ncbi:outer membrane protein assembly factor BamA [Pedobacter cryoconitis]|uniref:Outer membrane protein assembly factor BamA n=1 Tax=Pedobacter cryoconitis TaxID=188932 RepID=A0A7W8YRR6_9SPHI|nr:BamA/TamA family outer membrane protein [Pedobacter cryoconitis]MBB5620621.1 outer membrane protein assembly factor BamA [Pedobacter cryoconitis]